MGERLVARLAGLQRVDQGPVSIKNLRRTGPGFYKATVEGHDVTVSSHGNATNPKVKWDIHWRVWSETEKGDANGYASLFLGEGPSMKKALQQAGEFLRVLRAKGHKV